MKNMLVLLFSVLSVGVLAQDFTNAAIKMNTSPVERELFYNVRGAYTRAVSQDKVKTAQLIRDFVDGYPSSWITDYISVEIVVNAKGKQQSATGPNEVLTREQKNVLMAAETGSEILINVHYIYENSAMKKRENKQINLALSLIPAMEAEYSEGYEQLINYLRKNSEHKISKTFITQMQMAEVRFTVDEQGKVGHAKILTSSGNPGTDQVLIDLIMGMSDWKPAMDAEGKPISQEFQFGVGNGGC